MKRQVVVLAAIALSFGFVATSLAQTGGHDMSTASVGKSQAQTHKASGTVTKVDRIANKVTIAHGPVESLKWPAMTMNFLAKDKALLDRLSAGKKVEFEFVQQGRDYVITSAR